MTRLVLLLGGSASGKSSLVPLSDDKGRILVAAHEALFNAWEQPKSWLDEDRDNIRLQDAIRRAAQEWNTGGREIQFLVHRGTRLEAVEALARQPRIEVDTVARDYVQACVNLREAERETEL